MAPAAACDPALPPRPARQPLRARAGVPPPDAGLSGCRCAAGNAFVSERATAWRAERACRTGTSEARAARQSRQPTAARDSERYSVLKNATKQSAAAGISRRLSSRLSSERNSGVPCSLLLKDREVADYALPTSMKFLNGGGGGDHGKRAAGGGPPPPADVPARVR